MTVPTTLIPILSLNETILCQQKLKLFQIISWTGIKPGWSGTWPRQTQYLLRKNGVKNENTITVFDALAAGLLGVRGYDCQ
jgi:hypothetical protein